MNNHPNYPYLAGMLQSEIANLAYDEKFFKMKNAQHRIEYVKNIISNAEKKAIEYAEKMDEEINVKRNEIQNILNEGSKRIDALIQIK